MILPLPEPRRSQSGNPLAPATSPRNVNGRWDTGSEGLQSLPRALQHPKLRMVTTADLPVVVACSKVELTGSNSRRYWCRCVRSCGREA
ncbi:hypothetical protein [Streptomyces sirii]|uniref:hypothetical protein n=1 Tax=Streptomyces sirii TaxID=3127701 RepID=UPI003D35A77E